MKLPEIRIYFAWLLFYGESKKLAEKFDFKLESYEYYENRTEQYRNAWREREGIILEALQASLGVYFYRSVIDVACAPFFIPKSEPLIMNFRSDPDEFIDVLTHELCHVLLTDNNKSQLNGPPSKLDLIKEWQQFYGEEEFNVLVHIPVHALSKYIYLDVLKQPERLKRDQASVASFAGSESYVKAWKYVDEHDYHKIIEQLHKLYT